MRIGTRITLTTSVLVAVTLAVYGFVSLRSLRSEREQQVELQVREQAALLRIALERAPKTAPEEDRPALAAELSRSFERSGLAVEILDARDAPSAEAPPTGNARLERLRQVTTIHAPIAEDAVVGGRRSYVYVEPIRVLAGDGYKIVAAIQLTRDLTSVDADMTTETWKMVVSMLALIGVLMFAISLSARSGINRPIEKLIAGIDDVTRGDLSHVILKEREDEIGQLAARFNDMTYALREARGETRRGVEERLALQDHLRRSAQLATVGQLAAEIAHEVGTPLNVVTGRARAMAKKAEDPEAVQKNATIIAEQAARIARIIQRLLDFARRRAKVGETETKTPVDLNLLCEGTIEFLEHQLLNARIETKVHADRALLPVAGEKDQLQQVLLNLFVNAIQAMPDGGRLEITTARVVRRRPGLELAPEQRYAVLEVADTGVGIPEKDREKIFEPFYTSKAETGGTGLGLAIAHGIVKDHDGWMEIDENTAAGRGTLFRVFLPTTDSERGRAESAPPVAMPEA